MLEFRTAYNAPCGTGKFRKPGYVPTRIDLCITWVHIKWTYVLQRSVCQVPTGTGKAMLHPFSKPSTDVAGLGGIGRFHEFNLEPDSFGLVSDKVLKLAEGPAMQPRPHPAPGLDAGPDMSEVLHAEAGGPSLEGLRDDGFAGDVVDVADMPLLLAGDGLELPFGSTATVGLEAAAGGKITIPVMPELPAAKHLSRAGGSEVVFPDIQAHGDTARKRHGIREVEHQVQIPYALAAGEPRFLRRASSQKRLLERSAFKPYPGPALGGEEGECLPLDRVGAVIKADGRGREVDRRDGLILWDAAIGSKRSEGIRHPVDGLADHLATQGRKLLPDLVIDQVVQSDPIPAAVVLDERDDGIAGIRKESRQIRKRFSLLRRGQELERSSPFHFAFFRQSGWLSSILSSPP